MKVVFCRWGSICEHGILNAFKRLGIDVIIPDCQLDSVDYDTHYLDVLANILKDNKDVSCVFSINYHPIVSRCCKVFKVIYISWTVDCPSFPLYSNTISNSCNRIFLFDRLQYEKFSPYNPTGIFHLPLGSDFDTLDSITVSNKEHELYDCDISFIGSLYSEKTKYNDIESLLPDKIKGYVDGLINAQLNVYGYNLIEDSITTEWANEFKSYVNWFPLGEDYTEDVKAIVADTYIGYKCTETERITTLNAIAENFNVDLWTLSDTTKLPKVKCRGGADSSAMMPQIIKCSKINLNFTNRPIKTGIPLRVFDLMGCGGFVLSNYQPEILDIFTPDQDIVLYESIPDLLDKIKYYLEHEDERIQIAKNGHEKIKHFHTYDLRIMEMFRTCGLL